VKFASASFKIPPTRVKLLFSSFASFRFPGSGKNGPGKKTALVISIFGPADVALCEDVDDFADGNVPVRVGVDTSVVVPVVVPIVGGVDTCVVVHGDEVNEQ